MNYEKNLKYFKSTDTLFYVGLPILIVGGLLIVLELFWFYFLPYQMFIGAGLAVIGGAIAFVPRSLRTSEKELDAILESMRESYLPEVLERTGLGKHTLKNLPPILFSGYLYEGENILLRRGKDDRKWRSNLFVISALIPTRNGVYIAKKTVSLTEEGENEVTYELPYSEIGAALVKDTKREITAEVKLKEAHFILQKGEDELASLPCSHNVAADRMAEELCRLAKGA